MDSLAFVNKILTHEECITHKIYDAWGREPTTSQLHVEPVAIMTAFMEANPSLCIHATYGSQIIGYSYANILREYLEEAVARYTKTSQLDGNGNQKWGRKWIQIGSLEEEIYGRLFKFAGINLMEVAHRCGLVIVDDFSFNSRPDLKTSSRMIQESDLLIGNSGFKAIVVTPSHEASRKVFQREGYYEVIGLRVSWSDLGIVEANGAEATVQAMIKIFDDDVKERLVDAGLIRRSI